MNAKLQNALVAWRDARVAVEAARAEFEAAHEAVAIAQSKLNSRSLELLAIMGKIEKVEENLPFPPWDGPLREALDR
jgi:hypothetical protein